MSDWLDGRRALVVGAGSGIGRAVAERFMAEGARVGVLERDPDKVADLRAAFPEAPVTEGDASSYAANERAVAACVEQLGGVDILVSCVGVFDFYRSLVDLEPPAIDAAFSEIFDVNVKSCLHSVKAALPALQRASEPAIVLTESTSAYYPGRGGVLYMSSKFAVRGIVLALAHDLAPEIRVNGVAPGGTLGTDLRGVVGLGQATRSLGAAPGRAEALAERVPLRVALTSEDQAWPYVFLASTHARGVSGTCVHSDGGMSVAGAPRKRN